MSNLLEITGDDIARLNDTDLRTLIGLLCEADYRLAGLSTRGITWGGNQDASDGGLDVVVRGDAPPPSSSFVPRKTTGFQVKKPDMPRAEILKEMRPKDVLREEIRTLIQEKGAYIIISSQGSTTDSALKNRTDAMKEAVANEVDHQNLHVEFLDRGRVATWVRGHPALILWVRNKIGRQLKGWRSYENWASAPGGIEEEYLLDDGLRLHDETMPTGDGMSAKDGLLRLRSALSAPKASVRLTGLSGVGKTRLVQALFDERIGEQALNRSQVFYADMSNSPDPDPKTFAEQLIAGKARAILIVDNCPPDLHRRLTQTCSESHSAVSLLTVEYDVRDDLPEETSVFRLEPASEEVIEELIRKRFPYIDQIGAQAIAQFSGGNARIAIVLANTVQSGETLTGFRDEELFKRLFWQRHNPDESRLLISAQVCSLVYSFEGTDANSEKSELKLLASLMDKSGSELYRDVKALKDRDLIQSRDVWRAVLPHAIANRLAKQALEAIPKNTIVQTFLNSGSERLIKSFTRRLSYLHDCDTAREIANEWLAPGGWIGEANSNFSDFRMEVFRNIAPVSPEKALEAIERAANGYEGRQFISGENIHSYDFVRILRNLAYDPALFEGSVRLMCRYALSEKPGETSRSTRDVLKPLFYILFSGTHASVEARAKIVKEFINSKDLNNQNLGSLLLGAALKVQFFDSHHEGTFGARPRDFGYRPKTLEELAHWYRTFIDICTRLALSAQPIAEQARKMLADNLRSLWTEAHMFEALEISAKQLQEQKAWNEGWIAVRSIIRYDGKEFEEEISVRLHHLENLLRPNNLLEKARTYALLGSPAPFELGDDFGNIKDPSTAAQHGEKMTREIGAQVAQDMDTLNALLPELVSTHNTQLYSFGGGLADGCSNKQELWHILYAQFQKTSPENRQIGVFLGFLASCAESDPAFYHSTLDALISDDVLSEWFPFFQMTSAIDQRGLERLTKALDEGKARIDTFQRLAFGRAHESISDDDLANLLRKIFSREGGINVAIEVLQMRFHGLGKEAVYSSSSLLAVARDVMSICPFPDNRYPNSSLDYDLTQIAEVCLKGEEGKDAATAICQHLAEARPNGHAFAPDYPNLLNSLARAQPLVFLDVFLGNNWLKDYRRRRMFSDDFLAKHENPINQISDTDLLSWCESDPENRYPLIASVIRPFSVETEAGKLIWKPIVHFIFEKAPNLTIILEHFANGIRWPSSSWRGSWTTTFQERSVLLQALYQHNNPEISTWAKKQYQILQEIANREQEAERYINRKRNESFE